MKPVNTALISLLISLLSVGVSFGQGRKIENGDTILYHTEVAKQTGNNPVEYEVKSQRLVKLLIGADGTRNYVSADGKSIQTRDKFFTSTSWLGKPIAEKNQTKIFPQNQEERLGAGMDWKVPSVWLMTNCFGNVETNFHVVSKNGPEVTLSLDGREILFKTTQFDYKATVGYKSSSCDQFEKIKTILYSEEIGEIVSESYLEMRGVFLVGSGWRTTMKSVNKDSTKDSTSVSTK